MERIMTYETIRSFAYVNDRVVKKPIKGVVVNFIGLGGDEMYGSDKDGDTFFCEHGILYVHPYNNPWNWMNKQAVEYTNEVLDIVHKKYSALAQLPMAITGLSMGGCDGMLYALRGKYKPSVAVLNCPACDLEYQFRKVDLFQRIFYSAFWHEEGTIEEIFRRQSPICLADQLPFIDYVFYHSETDEILDKHAHSDAMVAKLRQLGHKVTYHEFTGCAHANLPEGGEDQLRRHLLDAFTDK